MEASKDRCAAGTGANGKRRGNVITLAPSFKGEGAQNETLTFMDQMFNVINVFVSTKQNKILCYIKFFILKCY